GGGTAYLGAPQGWTVNSLPATTAPTPGSALVFAPGAAAGANTSAITSIVNNLPAGTSFSSITFESGNVALSGNPIAVTSAVTVAPGATAATISLPLTITGAATFSVATSLTSLGVIGGPGSLLVTGGGTLVLGANNTYAGITTIDNSTTLQVGTGTDSGSPGSGDIGDNGNLVFNSASPLAVPNNISGTGTLTQEGAGMATLSGNDTHTGGTTIGTGATLQLAGLGSGSGMGAASMSNSGTLIFNYTSPTIYSSSISGSGNVIQEGAPVILTNCNTYTGGTTINKGTVLQVGNGPSSGTLGSSGVADNGSLIFDAASGFSVAGVSGSGSVFQEGAGTVTLTGSNTYSGGTTIFEGTVLQIGSGSGSGSASGSLSTTGPVVNNGSLVFGSAGSSSLIAGTMSGSGMLTQSASDSLTLTGDNSNFSGTITNYGTLQIGNGSSTGALGIGAVTNNGSLVFDINSTSSTLVVSANISGSGGLTQSGSDTVLLSGNNSYTGVTSVTAGILEAAAPGALPQTSPGSDSFRTITLRSGATLAVQVAPSGWASRDINYLLQSESWTSGSLGIDTPVGTSFSYGGITGGIGLVKLGGGTLVPGSNSYSGPTAINAGTVQATAAGVFGTGTVSVNAGGALSVVYSSALNTFTNALTGTGAVNLTANSTSAITPVFQPSSLSGFSGTVTIDTSQSNVDYQLTPPSGSTFNGSSCHWVVSGFNPTGFVSAGSNATSVLFGDLSGNGTIAACAGSGSMLTIGALNSSSEFDGILEDNPSGGALSLTKLGNGTLTIGETSTYSGGTTLSAGTINVSFPTALGTGPLVFSGSSTLQAGSANVALAPSCTITINSGVTATIDTQANSFSIPGSISGGGSLTKIGSGMLTLGGASNTYGPSSGDNTTISAGTLEFAASASPNGKIMINTGAALAATGAYPTAAQWLGSGLIDLGSSGTLALAGDEDAISMGNYSNLSLGALTNVTYTGQFYDVNPGTITPSGNTYRLGGGPGILTVAANLNDVSANLVVGGNVVLSP
ncbi:MAG: autotransporter-associated beta strand repeat-containing protein, partial [Thermoguttaceae bacterium]